MDITEFQLINTVRAKRWHNGDTKQWSLLEWAGAMAGETGEACNIAKKLRRLDFELPNKEAGLNKTNINELKHKLGTEIADSIIYGLIVLSEIDIDASSIIAEVFDKKSIEYGFPERAPVLIKTRNE